MATPPPPETGGPSHAAVAVRAPDRGGLPNRVGGASVFGAGSAQAATWPSGRFFGPGLRFFSEGQESCISKSALACLPALLESGGASPSTASLPFGFRVLDDLATAALLGFPSDAMDCSDVLKQGTKPLGVDVDAVAFLESTLDEISSICSNEAGKPPCFACAVVHNALKSPALQRSS